MRHPDDGGAVEEFVLDDRDLLRLCEVPLQRSRTAAAAAPRRPHLRTVSIIDTLSALARGAADRDVPPPPPPPPQYARRTAQTGGSSHWRRSRRQERDWSRQYASDSEVKGGGDACSVLSLRSQPPRRSSQEVQATTARVPRVPNWICAIFRLAKKGDLEALSQSLRDMERELVWNLSDAQGNSLWHVCAARNHLRCFQWLCQGHPQHVLADENHSSLTPVGTAVKHGNLEIVQWLVSKSWALEQINPPEGNRNLLHLAAKYGQERVVRWLAEYMQNNNLNINRKDNDGNTPVHLAAKHGHISVIKTLVLYDADVTAQNEQGLRPHGVAVQSGQAACADHLLTTEVCLCLSSEQVLIEGNFQSLQIENSEMKNGFRELLMLTKRLLRRQEEMLHYVQVVCAGNMNSDKAESDSADSLPWNSPSANSDGKQTQAKLQALLEKTQLKLLPEEESRLLQLEEKWRRLRVNKCAVETRSPLELIRQHRSNSHWVPCRSHFAQALAKCSGPHIQPDARPASSSSLSDYSGEESAEEEQQRPLPAGTRRVPEQTPAPWEQEVRSWDKVQVFLDGLLCNNSANSKHGNNQTPTRKANNSTNTLVIRHGSSGHKSQVKAAQSRKVDVPKDRSQENVSLKVLFENNPELRQEGQTCSVLEVLEPSSSDAEEDLNMGLRRGGGDSSSSSFRSNENAVLHVAEQRHPKQPGATTNGERKGKGAIVLTNIAELPDCSSRYKVSFKIQQSQECPHLGSAEVTGKDEVDATNDKRGRNTERQMSFMEPDLIRGTSVAERCALERCAAEASSVGDCPSELSLGDSASQDLAGTESVEEQQHEHVTQGPSSPECSAPAGEASSGAGSAKKRSGFLLKFSLRGRWPSKQKQQRKSEEISAEEFRETYTRSAGAEPSCRDPLPEQATAVVAKTSQVFAGALSPPPIPTVPRRGPPPVPPCEEEEGARPESPVPSLGSKCSPADDEGLLYLHSGSPEPSILRPDSIVSKTTGGSLSRPASSASQTEDGRRGNREGAGRGNVGVVGFSLPKTLSSTEVLLLHTPESSVAGRQSPAPSEVSKTESALSPPSDVSKTESARQAPPLGKIEEIVAAGAAAAAAVASAEKRADPLASAALRTRPSAGVEDAKQEGQPGMAAVTVLKQDTPPHQAKASLMTLAARKNKKSSKPWYEVSDEEDMLSPDKYQTVRARSSSEDETDLAVVA
ncbi:unnamed protein product [Ixodes hexagonus]